MNPPLLPLLTLLLQEVDMAEERSVSINNTLANPAVISIACDNRPPLSDLPRHIATVCNASFNCAYSSFVNPATGDCIGCDCDCCDCVEEEKGGVAIEDEEEGDGNNFNANNNPLPTDINSFISYHGVNFVNFLSCVCFLRDKFEFSIDVLILSLSCALSDVLLLFLLRLRFFFLVLLLLDDDDNCIATADVVVVAISGTRDDVCILY